MKIWINRAGQNLGTFTLEEVQRGLAQGQFVGTDLGWQEGMETWKPLSEFPGLQIPPAREPDVPATPPPPSAAVSQTTLATIESREEGPAWEQRQTLGVVKALFETWKEILLRPDIAFSRMKTSGGFASPLLFNAVMVIIWAIFMLIYQFIFAGSVGGAMAGSSQADSGTMAALGVGTSAITVILIFSIAIPLIVAMNFVSAGITHLCLSLFKGTSKSYEATYRVLAYSYSAWIFAIVPCIGGLVAGVWALICTIIGLAKVHKTEGWRAAVGVLLPVFVCLLVTTGVYLAILAMVFSSLHNANN